MSGPLPLWRRGNRRWLARLLRLFRGLQCSWRALARWWVVFGKVVENDYMTDLQAAPCLIATTDRYSPAQALCTSGHPLGIPRYSATLLCIGIGFIAVALATSPRAGRC